MRQLVTGRLLLDCPAESPAHAGRDIHCRSLHQTPRPGLETGAVHYRLEKSGIIGRRGLQAGRSTRDAWSRSISCFTKRSVSDRCIVVESRLPDEAASIHAQRIEHQGLYGIRQWPARDGLDRLAEKYVAFTGVLKARARREGKTKRVVADPFVLQPGGVREDHLRGDELSERISVKIRIRHVIDQWPVEIELSGIDQLQRGVRDDWFAQGCCLEHRAVSADATAL